MLDNVTHGSGVTTAKGDQCANPRAGRLFIHQQFYRRTGTLRPVGWLCRGLVIRLPNPD